MEDLLPAISVLPAGADPDDPPPIDPAALFGGGQRRLWLEVGFGGGEHLAARAEQNPDVAFIGCEPFINGAASLLRRLEAGGGANVRVHNGDARPIMRALPDGAVERVFLLFPDPWPKTRHHKRRFVSAPVLDELARITADGAGLTVATDHPGYARWTLERLIRHDAFCWPARSPRDWRRPGDWIETRYEAKALAAGRRCFYLLFRRRQRQAPAPGP